MKRNWCLKLLVVLPKNVLVRAPPKATKLVIVLEPPLVSSVSSPAPSEAKNASALALLNVTSSIPRAVEMMIEPAVAPLIPIWFPPSPATMVSAPTMFT